MITINEWTSAARPEDDGGGFGRAQHAGSYLAAVGNVGILTSDP